MRVAYLLAASAVGGGNQSLMTLWRVVRHHTVEPVIFCPQPGAMMQLCQNLGFSAEVVDFHQPTWRQPWRSWRALGNWQQLLKSSRVELVHANWIHGARSVCLAAWRAQLPLVCHIRFPPGRQYADWVFRGLPKPDLFIFNSRAVHTQAGPDLARACPRSQQEVIYNAVDLDSFTPKPKPSATVLRVGIVANLSPIKGHEDFLAAARKLLDRGHRCEFWIIGEDIAQAGYRDHLVRLADTLKLNGHVQFLGFRSDIAEILNQLDVLVSSSHYETFGRTLLEAMACERPVVATAVGGMPEVVQDGLTGFLVPPRDPEALAEAVSRLLQNEPLRRQLGQAGRVRAESLFGGDSHAHQVLTLYRRLLG